MASDAAAAGKDPWECRRFLSLGKTDQAGYFLGCDGILTRATINVIQAAPSTAASARLVLTQNGAVTVDGMNDPQNYAISIDVTEVGKRQFSIDA